MRITSIQQTEKDGKHIAWMSSGEDLVIQITVNSKRESDKLVEAITDLINAKEAKND